MCSIYKMSSSTRPKHFRLIQNEKEQKNLFQSCITSALARPGPCNWMVIPLGHIPQTLVTRFNLKPNLKVCSTAASAPISEQIIASKQMQYYIKWTIMYDKTQQEVWATSATFIVMGLFLLKWSDEAEAFNIKKGWNILEI